MDGLLLDAMYAKYHADKADAVARLNVYLTNSVGIGEHPDVMAAIEAEVTSIAQAHEKIEVINHYFLNR